MRSSFARHKITLTQTLRKPNTSGRHQDKTHKTERELARESILILMNYLFIYDRPSFLPLFHLNGIYTLSFTYICSRLGRSFFLSALKHVLLRRRPVHELPCFSEVDRDFPTMPSIPVKPKGAIKTLDRCPPNYPLGQPMASKNV